MTNDWPEDGTWGLLSILAVMDRSLSAEAVRVLGLLAWYYPKIYPSVATIADHLGCKPRVVQHHLRKLEECGYLKRHHRMRVKGGYTTTVYELIFPPVPRSKKRQVDIGEPSPPLNTPDAASAPRNANERDMQPGCTSGEESELGAPGTRCNLATREVQLGDKTEVQPARTISNLPLSKLPTNEASHLGAAPRSVSVEVQATAFKAVARLLGREELDHHERAFVDSMLRAGCDLQLHILPTMTERLHRWKGHNMAAYFGPAILETRDNDLSLRAKIATKH